MLPILYRKSWGIEPGNCMQIMAYFRADFVRIQNPIKICICVCVCVGVLEVYLYYSCVYNIYIITYIECETQTERIVHAMKSSP